MIHVYTRCPKCYQCRPSSRMHFLFKAQTHPSRSTPCRFFPAFSPCQAFKSVVQSRPHVSIHSNHTSHHAPVQSPPPHHLTFALFAFGSSLHGCFAFVCHPAITLSASPATCASCSFGLRVRTAFVVIGYVSCSSSVDMLLRQALFARSVTLLPSLEAHTASHTCDNRDDYLCVSPI